MTTDNTVTIKDLLEAGVHFGHKSAAWNPKMEKYIFIKRKGVHIIDLQKTALLLEKAYNYIKNVVANGGKVMFVGTKKQARELIKNQVKDTGHYYMTHRWVGGLLTNFEVVRKSIEQLKTYNDILSDPEKQKQYIKKDLFKMKKKRDHLNQTFEGVLTMEKIPDMIFIVDTFNEENCVLESNLSHIPICGMVDTNSNPEKIDVVIPSNDDAIRSISLFVKRAIEAIKAGEKIYQTNQNELSLFEEQIKEDEKAEAKAEAEEEAKAKEFAKSDIVEETVVEKAVEEKAAPETSVAETTEAPETKVAEEAVTTETENKTEEN